MFICRVLASVVRGARKSISGKWKEEEKRGVLGTHDPKVNDLTWGGGEYYKGEKGFKSIPLFFASAHVTFP